jgi:hypothetical protein
MSELKKTSCKNVFKNSDKAEIKITLTKKWVEIINQLERNPKPPQQK